MLNQANQRTKGRRREAKERKVNATLNAMNSGKYIASFDGLLYTIKNIDDIVVYMTVEEAAIFTLDDMEKNLDDIFNDLACMIDGQCIG